ncbi:ABC transporter ATP-binding protein [Lapidilactobacillus bayanensis]|uniref:ABC transporter ATP-binding protein n=1 Tax=Lapidilactobacillus bayanensis TaxID=2485998 RepID=UPI000F7A9720|nr:ABC transporter ATP-binding protein [Lapidilactobacillus bayanensis]
MAAKIVLDVQHVQKKFGKFQALTDITFQVHQGEVVGFIGPNGAGKSTTIRTILGMLKADGGTVKVFGEDAWSKSVTIHQRLTYVPGDVYLWPNFTGGQTIDLLLKMSGQKHNAKTDELIKEFELDPTKKNQTYSKGNRQKIALIAALSCDVDFYIFDEPTSGLDPLNEVIFQKEIERLKQEGKAILLSSHILSEVEKMGDTIVIIRQGNIVEAGSLAEMRHLTRTNITVTAAQSLAAIKTLKGVHQFKFTDDSEKIAEFSVDSDALQAVMQALTNETILNIQVAQPTLEDLFMRYYGATNAEEVSGRAE